MDPDSLKEFGIELADPILRFVVPTEWNVKQVHFLALFFFCFFFLSNHFPFISFLL